MASTAAGSDEPGTPHAQQTLTTPELLETILKNLDVFELVDARYVSRFWKDLVDSSPSLQKIIFNNDEVWNDLRKTHNNPRSFFVPTEPILHLCNRHCDKACEKAFDSPGSDTEEETLVDPGSDTEEESLVDPDSDTEEESLVDPDSDTEEESLASPGSDTEQESLADSESDPETPLTVKLHPSLRHVNTWHPDSRFSYIKNFTFRFWERKLVVYPRKGFWRKQLICQPPVDLVDMHYTNYQFPTIWPWGEVFGYCSNPQGVTLGELQDYVLEAVDHEKEWLTTEEGRELRPGEAMQYGAVLDGGKWPSWRGINAMKPGDREELELAEWEGNEVEEDGLTKRQKVQLLRKVDFYGDAELPGVKPVTKYADA